MKRALDELVDELIEKILEVLQPQLDGQVEAGQVRAMQDAIAFYTNAAALAGEGETQPLDPVQLDYGALAEALRDPNLTTSGAIQMLRETFAAISKMKGAPR